MRDALVVSCERSGTHLMINTLADSFGYNSKWRDLDNMKRNLALPAEMQAALEELVAGSRGNLVIKSHHAIEFFIPIWEYIESAFDVFYVYRDGRDVLTSQWNHYRVLDTSGLGPVTFRVSDFITASPAGTLCTRYDGSPPPCNMTERWSNHVVGWMQKVMGVTHLSYDQAHSVTLEKIATRTGILPRSDKKPLLGGITPWKGKRGNWRAYFDAAASERFWRYGREGMEAIGLYSEAFRSVRGPGVQHSCIT